MPCRKRGWHGKKKCHTCGRWTTNIRKHYWTYHRQKMMKGVRRRRR